MLREAKAKGVIPCTDASDSLESFGPDPACCGSCRVYGSDYTQDVLLSAYTQDVKWLHTRCRVITHKMYSPPDAHSSLMTCCACMPEQPDMDLALSQVSAALGQLL